MSIIMSHLLVYDTQDLAPSCALYIESTSSLIIGTKSGELIELNQADLKQKKVIKTGQNSIECLAKGESDDIWVGGSNEIQLYTSNLELKYSLNGHDDSVVGLSQDKNLLYSASEDRSVVCWDLSKKNPVTLYNIEGPAIAFDYCKKKQKIITACSESQIILYDIAEKKETKKDVSDKVWALKFVKEFIVTGDNNGKLNVFRHGLETFKEIDLHQSRIKGIDFNEDVVVTCSFDYSLMVVKISDWTVLRKLDGHADWVRGVKCVDNVVFSLGDDRKVIGWDINSTELKNKNNEEKKNIKADEENFVPDEDENGGFNFNWGWTAAVVAIAVVTIVVVVIAKRNIKR